MRILVKNGKWIISFKDIKLESTVYYRDDIYNLEFPYKNKNVKIKTVNLDETLKYLEKLFDESASA
ncbi:MAG: hypothetical protein MJH09_04315 [Cetobacterium sp.]|uniref:Uncharacterized protein n=1 Tax=Cetobacterium ceti TaxID=180163 RepID=A0A1T4JR25_9FUSO|nr:hypothetical protein [Cetobacterium ceti]MCJ8342065.1 hypothetical protein [Cetobacterium sp.]SJZ32672.1 hypothetical protein SAMN02745174_00011 [Cetobacterium ceti]